VANDKDPKKNFAQESNEVSIRTVNDIDLVLKGGSVERAEITVKKFVNQKWESQTFIVKPGEEIGRPFKKWIGREQVTIDYSTHYKLIELMKEKKSAKWALKMVFIDDEGKKQEEWQAE